MRSHRWSSIGQSALWKIRPLCDEPLPLFQALDNEEAESSAPVRLPKIMPFTQVLHDYGSTGLSLKAHPVSFIREELERMGAIPTSELRDERRCPSKRSVCVAGLVLCRQRPGIAFGVTFITLEDETGIANLIVWRDTFERYRGEARLSAVLLVRSVVQRQGQMVHMHAQELASADGIVPAMRFASRDFH
jgi:error-prone DNA polymerase